jgi:hypothetical protein
MAIEKILTYLLKGHMINATMLTRNFFLQNLLKKRETFGDRKNLEIFA